MFRRRSLESCLRSKDSRAVWRGAVGKGPQGTSLVAYPTSSTVLNGEDEETGRKALRLVLTQRWAYAGLCLSIQKGRRRSRTALNWSLNHVSQGLSTLEGLGAFFVCLALRLIQGSITCQTVAASAAVPLSIREIRHLFWRLVLATRQRAERVLAWSAWRRWHQGIAQYWHYRRRAIVQLQL